jgi:transposase
MNKHQKKISKKIRKLLRLEKEILGTERVSYKRMKKLYKKRAIRLAL